MYDVIYCNLSWSTKFVVLVLRALFSWDYADVETNECLENNGGCWRDKASNVTACRVCFVGIIFNQNHFILSFFFFYLSLSWFLSHRFLFIGYISGESVRMPYCAGCKICRGWLYSLSR